MIIRVAPAGQSPVELDVKLFQLPAVSTIKFSAPPLQQLCIFGLAFRFLGMENPPCYITATQADVEAEAEAGAGAGADVEAEAEAVLGNSAIRLSTEY